MAKAFGKRIAFASADIFGGGSFNIVNFLYPGFLALTVGISPFYISFVMLVARVWDAIIDPIIGNLSDRTHSKLGKRRIYLVIASPFVLVSMFLMFYPFGFSSEILRVIAVLVSYLLFVTVQSSVMIPYYSLSSEISRDYSERARYNSYRLGFSIFASILCVAVPGIIISLFEDETIGYQVMSLSFGLIFGLSVLFTGLFAKEEIHTGPIRTKFTFKEITKPLHLKPFRQYLGMFITLQISMAVMSGLYFFYADFYLTKSATFNGEATMVGLISAALMFAMQIVALPFYLKLIDTKGKTFAYRFGSYLWIICGLLLLLIPADVTPIYIYLLAAAMGFGISGPGLVPHTMYGDVVDAGEVALGNRLDGQMSGFTNFINQIAQGVGIAFVMAILGFAGFQEQVPGTPEIVSQPDSAMLAIRLIMAFVPLVFMGIGTLISFLYKVDKKKQQELQDVLLSGDETEKAKLAASLNE